jgi:hypothetical protein
VFTGILKCIYSCLEYYNVLVYVWNAKLWCVCIWNFNVWMFLLITNFMHVKWEGNWVNKLSWVYSWINWIVELDQLQKCYGWDANTKCV